ncbi:MAG: hypothetical protein V1750_11075 [Acidobacteriota bacterium]
MRLLPAIVSVLAVLSMCPRPGSAQMSRGALLAKGVNLPKQWGIGVVYYNQKQPYKLDSLKLGLPGFDPAAASGLPVDNDATSYHAVFDYWALPFLNLELLAGNIDGSTGVGLSKVNIGMPLDDITVNYKGFFYGAGFTLAAGSPVYFATITTEYSRTKLDNEDSSVSAWVVTPRFGVNISNRTSLFVGAMYQDPAERHQGTYDIPHIATVPYDVTLTGKYAWNYLAGAYIGLGEHWKLNLEAGFGDRDSAQAYLSYRW